MATAFISYSHRDEVFRQEFETHLAPLRRQGLLSVWHDRRITAGDPLDEAISENLESADLILMLISADFVASEYCYTREMTRALERHEAKTARAVSIICRPCDFHGLPFAKFVLLPTDAKAVSSWTDRDAAWVDVVKGIRGALLENSTGISKRNAKLDSEWVIELPRLTPRRRTFSETDLDDYGARAWKEICASFEKELRLLELRDSYWKGTFNRISDDLFNCRVEFDETCVAVCTLFRGPIPRAICYCDSLETDKGRWAEFLDVIVEWDNLTLRASNGGYRMDPLLAARHFFARLMEQAERSKS